MVPRNAAAQSTRQYQLAVDVALAVNVAWLNPILSFLPAAIILGFRLSRRRSWIIGTVLAMVVVMAGVVVQRGFFPITTALCQCWPLGWSPLPAATGGNRRGGCRTSPLVGLVWIPFARWLVRRPFEWRVEYVEWVAASVAVVIVGSSSLAVWQTRNGE